MTQWPSRVTTLSLFVCTVVVTACAGATEPSRFYTLSTPPELEQERPKTNKQREISIGVGPVELPPYLDRPQIVTQSTRHKLDLAEFDQWAEPLRDNFTRVLAENLSVLMATDQIAIFPWRRPVSIDYQIAVKVIRFDTASGATVLVARWNLFGKDGRELLYTGRSSFRQPVNGASFEATVAAMSETLADFSREVATATLALSQ